MGQTKEQKVIKQLSNPASIQKFTAVAGKGDSAMFLPNPSVAAAGKAIKAKFSKLTLGGEFSLTNYSFGDSLDRTLNIYTENGTDGITMECKTDGATGPILDWFMNSASPAQDDEVGRFRFIGNDADGDQRIYAQMRANIEDANGTTPNGSMKFQLQDEGNLNVYLTLDARDNVKMVHADFPIGQLDRDAYFISKRLTTGDGDDVYIEGADGKGENKNGGNVYINSGSATGAGTDGKVYINGVEYTALGTTGNLTATAPAYFDNTRQVIGGAAALTLKNDASTALTSFSTDGTLAGNTDTDIPTEKAVKTYVDKFKSYDVIIDINGTGDYTSIATAMNGTNFGDHTTQFDITNPSGTTFRYTYDGTGTDPGITSSTIPTGTIIGIQIFDCSPTNCGVFKVTDSGTNYFEITNEKGVVESNKVTSYGGLAIVKNYYIKEGDYTEATTPRIPAGSNVFFDNVIIRGNLIFSGPSKVNGKLKVIGSGEVLTFNANVSSMIIIYSHGCDYSGLNLTAINTATSKTNQYEVILCNGQFNIYGHMVLEAINIDMLGTAYAGGCRGFSLLGSSNTFLNCVVKSINDSHNPARGALGLIEWGDYNSINCHILNCTTTNGNVGEGVYIVSGGDYNSIMGSSRGCDLTNLSNNGTGNKVGDLAV